MKEGRLDEGQPELFEININDRTESINFSLCTVLPKTDDGPRPIRLVVRTDKELEFYRFKSD
ncbi:hypothetical protein HYT84_02895 [Candidatus Micrarchaeota archaeon]|nr:hypothetical protein [Candidatus Micrarchaeota archaeon]